MPWEQFDGAPPNHETPPPTSSNPTIESLDVPDVLIDLAPVGLAPQELEVPPSESAGLIQEANCLDQEMLPSILAEPPFPSSGHRDDGIGDPIVERLPYVGEGLTPSCSEEQTADVGRGITSSVGSLGLSSPMPWEQIENSTIRIEEAAPSSTPLAQEGTPLLGGESVLAPFATTQPESVSGHLASPAPAPDLTEPIESIFAVEPSTSPAVFQSPKSRSRPPLIPRPGSHFHGAPSSTAHGSLPQELCPRVRLPQSPNRMRFHRMRGT